jgi:hypothetical protein
MYMLGLVKCTYRTCRILLEILPFALYINLCQYRLCKADDVYLTLQRQFSHLNGRKPHHWQVKASYFFFAKSVEVKVKVILRPTVQSASLSWNKAPIWGLRPDLYYSESQSHIATDGQSICLSWCWAPSAAHDQILITVWQLLSCPWEGALWREDGSVYVDQSAELGQLSVCTIFTFYICHMLLNTYTIYTRPPSVRAQYSRLCPISGSFPITAV